MPLKETTPNSERTMDAQDWPEWPIVTPQTEQILRDALYSKRWTVSGAYRGAPSYEQKFAKAFARFQGIEHCVPTCHGTTGLTVALEALGVGFGDEVLVPGLTWVACATAVAAIGAVPVLVDVDTHTLCMDAESARHAITGQTKAILLVHAFGSAADLDAFTALSQDTGIPLLEDCSQAHGAKWRGQRVGSFGAIGACSFQQTKLMTSGEGGAAFTNDPVLAERMDQLRADGRRTLKTPTPGYLDLEETGFVQGRNFCLSEFHAALLLEALERLDSENQKRRDFVDALRARLNDVDGCALQHQPKGLTDASYYHMCLQFAPQAFGGATIDQMAEFLAEDLSIPEIEPVDTPLTRNVLYNPAVTRRTPPGLSARITPSSYHLPMAEEARRISLTFPHRVLLADPTWVAKIVEAIEKMRVHFIQNQIAAQPVPDPKSDARLL